MFHPDSGDYEFSEEQNSRIRRLSSVMFVFGALSIVLAGALLWRTSLLYGALHTMTRDPHYRELYLNSQNVSDLAVAVLQGFLGAMIPLLFGVLSVRASRSFSEIVQTEGSDIPNLMDALRSLGKAYTLGFAGALIMFTLLAVSLFMARYLLVV
jgi:hypothetical protein